MGLPKKVEAVVVEEIKNLPPEKRALVLAWSRDAKTIVDNNSLTPQNKLIALRKLETATVVKQVLLIVLQRTKVHLWDDRPWGLRLALGGAAIGLATLGGQFAGIATAGFGIGVPIFLITASGGALLGVIIDELQKDKNK